MLAGTIKRAIARARHATKDSDNILDFLNFALPLSKLSKSQHMQDIWAAWENRDADDCYFVEFGGADGVTLSNTFMLERELGWSGVLAEPNPAFENSIRNARTCEISTKCVYSVSAESIEFLPARKGMLSRIAHIVPDDRQEWEGRRKADPISVETISLNDLLIAVNAPETIHFMSVDTEGSELHILDAFDFARWDVRTLCVEHSDSAKRERLFDLLTGHGYVRKWSALSVIDDWYVKRDA